MKILFVDDRSSLQDKWIEPLRGEGWGVIRTRSTQDAEKIFEFHGDSLDALVVSEDHVEWAANWSYPYVVLLNHWKETQVMKHQNTASHPAVAFIDFDSNLQLLKQAVEESRSRPKASVVKSTGTGQSSIITTSTMPSPVVQEGSDSSKVISLEEYGKEKGEIVSTSLKPQAPVIEEQQEVEATRVIETPAFESKVDQDRTMVIDPTTMANLEFSAIPVSEVAETPVEDSQSEEELELAPAIEEMVVPSASSLSAHGDKDLETMRNYLALREQDVAVLTGQLRTAQDRVQNLELQLKVEKARNAELHHLNQKQDQKLHSFEQEKMVEFEVLHQQVEDLNLQLRERTDRVRGIEAKLKLATEEVDKVKERVRVDIRRIRVREKELESQLEILKKDSTALLIARDEKILELKRKIDLLEFNMELVQEQYGKERNVTEQLRHKLKEAASAMKRAGGLLDHEN